jgi:hypothetical protein
MAYVDQSLKAKLAPTIREICKKYGVKGSIAVRNHSTLVLNIRQGNIDFIGNFNRTVSERPGGFRNGNPAKDHIDVNTSWYQEHFDGRARAFLAEVIPAMEGPDYFDHSDIQSDYFHRSHYIDINIGSWNKPYALEK